MKQTLHSYWQSFSFVGLVVAALFFAASLTPSLLPRHFAAQGVLSGFSLAIVTACVLITTTRKCVMLGVWIANRLKQFVPPRVAGLTSTPPWMPTFRDSALVRFTAQQNHLDTGQRWGPIRDVYIQHASDPMVWFSPNLAWNRPDWLCEPRGPDVSPQLRWYPIVTFLQVAFDLPMATAVPVGYGHNYSPSSYIDAWIAVTDPVGWDAEKISLLKMTFEPE